MCLLFNIIREMLLFNIINEKLLFGALRLWRSFFFSVLVHDFTSFLCQIWERRFDRPLDSRRRALFSLACAVFPSLLPRLPRPGHVCSVQTSQKIRRRTLARTICCDLFWEGLEGSPETNPFSLLEKHTSRSCYSPLFALTHYSPICLFSLPRTHGHG